jgi:putative peptidoglycan lipid II flippase
VISLVANMGFNLLIVVPLALAGVPGLHAGLALAISLAAYLNAGLLFRRLAQEGAWRAEPGWAVFGMRMVVANGLMAGALWVFVGDLDLWLNLHAAARALRLGGLIVGAGAIYFVALLAMGVRLRDLRGHRP